MNEIYLKGLKVFSVLVKVKHMFERTIHIVIKKEVMLQVKNRSIKSTCCKIKLLFQE